MELIEFRGGGGGESGMQNPIISTGKHGGILRGHLWGQTSHTMHTAPRFVESGMEFDDVWSVFLKLMVCVHSQHHDEG